MQKFQEDEDMGVSIPRISYTGEDKRLTERVRKFKVGSFRILVFTLVGMVMGFYSYTYHGDNFLPMKILLAIPYKLSEFLYVHVIGTGAQELWKEIAVLENDPVPALRLTEFFPYSGLATRLAEHVTPMLIGGMVYGVLAYLTGDKRVFTMKRLAKFVGLWCMVIALFVAGVYGVNAYDSTHWENRPQNAEMAEVIEMTETAGNTGEEAIPID